MDLGKIKSEIEKAKERVEIAQQELDNLTATHKKEIQEAFASLGLGELFGTTSTPKSKATSTGGATRTRRSKEEIIASFLPLFTDGESLTISQMKERSGEAAITKDWLEKNVPDNFSVKIPGGPGPKNPTIFLFHSKKPEEAKTGKGKGKGKAA